MEKDQVDIFRGEIRIGIPCPASGLNFVACASSGFPFDLRENPGIDIHRIHLAAGQTAFASGTSNRPEHSPNIRNRVAGLSPASRRSRPS